jgi:hypothetical protein
VGTPAAIIAWTSAPLLNAPTAPWMRAKSSAPTNAFVIRP